MPVSVVEYEEATVVSILGATVILACRRDVEDPQWRYWKPPGWVWEIAHSADSQAQYPAGCVPTWRQGICVMFGPDRSGRSKGWHGLNVRFPKLVDAKETVVIHCRDGYHHSPLFFAMLLACHGYEHSLQSALRYVRGLRAVWPGYFDPDVRDARGCREALFWAEATVKNVLASPSPPVRQSNEDQGRATGSSWRPVIVTPEEGLKSATSKTKAVPPTYAMEDEAVPPPLPVPEASELESQTVVLSGSTPKAIPRPKPAAVSEEGQNEPWKLL